MATDRPNPIRGVLARMRGEHAHLEPPQVICGDRLPPVDPTLADRLRARRDWHLGQINAPSMDVSDWRLFRDHQRDLADLMEQAAVAADYADAAAATAARRSPARIHPGCTCERRTMGGGAHPAAHASDCPVRIKWLESQR